MKQRLVAIQALAADVVANSRDATGLVQQIKGLPENEGGRSQQGCSCTGTRQLAEDGLGRHVRAEWSGVSGRYLYRDDESESYSPY